MKKYRRGSKIVELVKRRWMYPNKNEENIRQISATPSESIYIPNQIGIEDPASSVQECTSNQQATYDQDDMLGSVPQDIAYNITIPPTLEPVEPSTSHQTVYPSYDDGNNKFIGNCLRPTSFLTLLDEDLYLTDSNDEYIPEFDDTTTSSSDFSDNNSITIPCRDIVHNAEKNHIDNEPSSRSIFISKNKELRKENVETNINNINREESVISGQQNRKRKRRQAVPWQWKKNVRKNKRQHGEPYVSAKGTLIPGKTLKISQCKGLCIHQCTSKVSEEERLKIFSNFWNINTVEQKRLYIVNLIHREKTKAIKRNQSRKQFTNKYFLQKEGAMEKIQVCQKFFIATLNVSETFVRFCFKKVIDHNNVVGDNRGKHAPHNKKSHEIREHVRDHIKSFPRMPSPLVRKYTKKEYLGRTLNLTKMYRLYQIKCANEQRESVELAYYRSVFKKDFNISFHRPGRDICDICLSFERMNEDEKEKEKGYYEEHLKRIIAANEHRDKAQTLAQSGEIHFAEYDLKAICDFPSFSFKLKRTIPVYNFTILDYNNQERDVHCFCWHEGIARRGATEIGSCLYKYLQCNANGKPITFMSDTCASQCRNMYISSLLLYCVEILDIPEINQKYFEQGHTQMETDDIHANIGKYKRNMAMLQPSGFYNIIKKSLRKYSSHVHEMKTDDFIDLKYLKNILIKNAKIDSNGEPVNWLNIRWLQYRKTNTNHIYFKYDLSDKKFKRIKVVRRGKRQQNCKDIVLLKKSYSVPYAIQ